MERGHPHVAVIVAHPDDETLWAGGALLLHPEWQTTVVTLCRGSDPDRAPKFFQGYEWTGTRAYSLGLGSIYLNLKGREGQGIVAPAEAPALVGELRDKLLQVTDPETHDKVFGAVYAGTEIWSGKSSADAPDIQVGYAEGYQTGKASASGAAPKDVFHPNDDKWSGEHASSDVRTTPGIFFVNRPAAEAPDIRDLGVTALEYLGVQTPEGFEGKVILK